MIYIKKLSANEKIKMEAAHILTEDKKIMLPYVLVGKYCIMPMAKAVVAQRRADPEKIADMLQEFYSRTVSIYSEGIYSFARQGWTRNSPDMPFYRYIKQELDSLYSHTVVKPEYARLEEISRRMWEKGYEEYKDTFFWSYNYLHGDLHTGNIVNFLGEYRLIDWENLRSGPKEIELAFYMCWDYFLYDDHEKNLQSLMNEVNIFETKGLINSGERDRILYLVIPMWMVLIILYLNNGNLMFEDKRKKSCEQLIPLYKSMIFDKWS